MSKKEELINDILMNYLGENIAKEKAIKIYDEIRASILTPQVVSLLKAIGGKPENCFGCELYNDEWDYCALQQKSAQYKNCPLLTSEELTEITGGDR